MWEAYAIGVTLKLNNLISPQLALLSQEMIKLDGLVIGLGRSIKAIGAESAAFKAIASGANASNRALEKASLSAAALSRHLTAISAGSAAVGSMPLLMPGGGRGPGGGGAGGGGGGGGSGGGRGFGHYAHGGNIHMGPGGLGIGTVGVGAGGAFVPLALTAAGIYGGHALYESAKGLDTERARFRLFGMSSGQNAEAFQFVDGARSYGLSRTDRMRLFRESQGVFRESGRDDSGALEGSKMALPIMAKLQFAMSALDEHSKARANTSMLAAIRYAEMSGGANDPKKFAGIMDMAWKLTQTSGGQVDFERLRQFKARAGSAGFHLSDTALASLEPIMGELQGSAAGVALRTAYGRIAGLTKPPNQAVHTLVNSGLWDAKKVQFNANGGIKSMSGSPISKGNLEMFADNPVEFYVKMVAPIYERMKYSSQEITRENALIFGREGGKFFDLIGKQLPLIRKSVDAMEKAAGIDKSVVIARQSLSGQEAEFSAAWADFKTSAGTTFLPFFSGLLKGGSTLLRGMQTSDYLSTPDALPGKRHGTMGASPYVATGYGVVGGPGGAGAGRGMINNTIVMPNGRVLAEVVTEVQTREASRPQSGGAGFDGRRALVPAGGGAEGSW